jgi:hypothetical protein
MITCAGVAESRGAEGNCDLAESAWTVPVDMFGRFQVETVFVSGMRTRNSRRVGNISSPRSAPLCRQTRQEAS